jgi:hypothetical protein
MIFEDFKSFPCKFCGGKFRIMRFALRLLHSQHPIVQPLQGHGARYSVSLSCCEIHPHNR